MKKALIWLVGIFGVFAPIELCVIILMIVMGIDTLVKLFAIKRIAKRTGRKYNDVFESKVLRTGYIYKAAGYLILAGAIFPIDFYFLTPFLQKGIDMFASSYHITILTTALFTNLLLIIFSLIEVSSINENWIDITGNNMLSKVFAMVKRIRGGIQETASFIKTTKDEIQP
jgi:hypothetical protein